MFNQQSGFWLIHSAPHFPSATTYGWPDTAKTYGQSALCVSFNYDQLPEIGKEFRKFRQNLQNFFFSPTITLHNALDILQQFAGRNCKRHSGLEIRHSHGQRSRSAVLSDCRLNISRWTAIDPFRETQKLGPRYFKSKNLEPKYSRSWHRNRLI